MYYCSNCGNFDDFIINCIDSGNYQKNYVECVCCGFVIEDEEFYWDDED